MRIDTNIKNWLNAKDNVQKVKRPVSAFVTFNDQEDQALFLDFFSTEQSYNESVIV